MKENELTTSSSLDRKLRAELLLGRRVGQQQAVAGDAAAQQQRGAQLAVKAR